MSFSLLTGWAAQAADLESNLGGTSVIIAFVAVLLAFFLIFALASYVYFSLALMKVAQRTKTRDPWLAWIPVANLYLMARIAKQPAWPLWFLLGTVPALFLWAVNLIAWIVSLVIAAFASLVASVFIYIWQWKICEIRHRPGWWAIILPISSALSVIPIIGITFSLAGTAWYFAYWGILAWGK